MGWHTEDGCIENIQSDHTTGGEFRLTEIAFEEGDPLIAARAMSIDSAEPHRPTYRASSLLTSVRARVLLPVFLAPCTANT